MEYSERMNKLMDQLNKSIDSVNKLDYFKRELLKVLDSKEKHEDVLSKSIQDYFNSINTTLFGIGIEKGKVGTIGEIRTWKDGKKYKKMPNGKWVRVYQSQNRSAEISIARLKGKVKNAQSVDELMNIVMNNIHRFEDENGNILPIVEELKKEVAASKGRINVGKPSTKEQIEKFKATKKNNTPVMTVKTSDIKVGDYVRTLLGDFTIKNITSKGDFYICDVEEENRQIKLRKNGNASVINKDYKNDYSEYIDGLKKEAESIFNSDIDPNEKVTKLVDFKDNDRKKYFDVDHDLYNQGMEVQDIRNFNYRIHSNFLDFINPLINKAYADTPEQKEKKRKEQEEKNRKENALKNKLDSINNNYKYEYSDEEIKAAFNGVEEIKNKYEPIKKEWEKLNIEYIDNKRNSDKQRRELLLSGKNPRNIEEWQKLDAKVSDLYVKLKKKQDELKSFESELDKYMDPIADYYLKMDWKKDSSIDNCKNINEVMDLIKSKDWYSEEGNKNLDLKGVDVECGKLIFKCMERIFAIFPERKGKNVSLDTNYSIGKTWATGSYWSGITFNRYYWKNMKEFEDSYNTTSGSYHPENTTAGSVVFHEYYHTITTKNDLARTIKNKVSKSLNLEDRKSGVKKDVLIAKGISEYATKDADEFGAEAFGQCLNSPNPSAFAREVFKETIKHVKYLKDDKGDLV